MKLIFSLEVHNSTKLLIAVQSRAVKEKKKLKSFLFFFFAS